MKGDAEAWEEVHFASAVSHAEFPTLERLRRRLDEDREQRMSDFLQAQVRRVAEPMCRACHEHPKVSVTGLCRACEDKARARWVFTPASDPEV